MSQPEYVPVTDRDRVRVSERLPPPVSWRFDRPGEVRQDGAQPAGPRFGVAGPDQGYALRLAEHMAGRLVLAPGERLDDVISGCLGVALRRAALSGRAPVMPDLEVAFGLWGYLGDAPEGLVASRKPLFAGCADHYNDRRAIADRVPEPSLRLTPADVRSRLAADWRALVAAPD